MTMTIGKAPARATLFFKRTTIGLLGFLACQGAAYAQFNLISQQQGVSVSSTGSGVALLPTGGGTRMTSWDEQDAARSSVAGPFSASLSKSGSTLSNSGQANASLDSMVASNAITAAGAFQVDAQSSYDGAYAPYGNATSKSGQTVKVSFSVNEPTDVLLAGRASSAVSRTRNGYAPDGNVMYYLTGTGAVSFALTGPDTNLIWRTGAYAGDVYGGEISPLSQQLSLNPGVYDLVISASASADPLSYAPGREIYGSGRGSFDFSLSAVPEPSSAWLMGLGLLGVAGVARARQARV